MKIAIVGGSAASTPALFLVPEIQMLADRLAVTLIGRSQSRLDPVRRAICAIAGDAFEVECATDLCALDGAEIVVLQARYGGYESRDCDETFPWKHGICGDEGLGPGGLAAAWRSWPALSQTLDTISERCPKTTVLLMTAPLSLLMRCALSAYPALDIVGICELPWVTLRSVCASLDAPVDKVAFSYAGVNHLGWLDEIELHGTDLITRYAAARDAAFPSAELIRSLGAIPLKYLDIHYQPEDVLKRQRSNPSRAEVLRSIQQRAREVFASGGRDEIVTALSWRPTPWYSDAVGPFIAGMAGVATSSVFFLSVCNDGYLPLLAGDVVLEQPFVIERGERRKLPRHRELRGQLFDTLERFVDYERAAALAILEGRFDRCAELLAKHPWVGDSTDVRALAGDLVAAI